MILVANQARDYPGGLAEFKAAVQAQPIGFQDGALHFATLTFYGPQRPPQIDGRPLDVAPPRGYDSPFVRSEWGNGLIHIRKGGDTLILDFRDAGHPRKTIGTATEDSSFPPGMVTLPPIVLPVPG